MTAPSANRRSGQPGITRRFAVGGAEGYLTTAVSKDGTLTQVIVRVGKHGSTLAGLTDALQAIINLGLRHGIPLAEIVRDLVDVSYDPKGATNDPDIRTAASITDYVGRRLALDHLSRGERVTLGVLTREEHRTPAGRRTTTVASLPATPVPLPRTSPLQGASHN
ncbi:hypothetical protein [Planomonospora sp. ID82291]|uniref:TSCPD domain-containing protein n=1 Tax=Planomonospora sp. ID82291 TaxID=2738136 RepID=UPI0018C3AE22|nr:hypothetical protein [Planomonospora sp. ID82291]MBG0818646.1 ribonucleoside-diphosphate reductase [Planomonospora sp. ID82291]